MAIFADSLSAASSNQRTATFAKLQVVQNLGTALGSGAFSFFLLSQSQDASVGKWEDLGEGLLIEFFVSELDEPRFCIRQNSRITSCHVMPHPSQGPEMQTDIWTGFQAKSALLTGFGLLFPVMLSLLAFRRAPQSKDSEHTEMKGERVMQRAWVPYLVLLALLFFALATGMIFKFVPLFLINIYNMSCVQISILQTVDPLLKAGFTYAVGACAQHVGRAQAASLCIAGIIGCLLGMSYLCSGSRTDVVSESWGYLGILFYFWLLLL